MKAALNGALNCSILDGWWDECYDGTNGWAIESAEDDPDQDRRDLREAGSLFAILENQVVPRFYDRARDGVPRQWVQTVLQAWASLGPQVTASRMVRDYTTALYEPAAASLAAPRGRRWRRGERAGELAPARARTGGRRSPSRPSTSTTPPRWREPRAPCRLPSSSAT